nr:amino acid adenylation domain-containing protein [Gordonia sp. SID5947]
MPLTAAQRAIWFAQQAVGDTVPLTIAQYVDLSGDVDTAMLCNAAREAQTLHGLGIARVHVGPDGDPMMVLDAELVPHPVCEMDFRDRDDPFGDADDWMSADASCPWPLNPSQPLVFCALIRLEQYRWLLYSRAHHIALDGYGAMTLLSDTAVRYQGLGTRDDDWFDGTVARWKAPIVAEDRYDHSARHDRDREYWRSVLDGFPASVVLGTGRGSLSAHRHLVGVDLDDDMMTPDEAADGQTEYPFSAVLVAAVAWCTARLRDVSVVPLTIATSARTSPSLRSAGGALSNLLPVSVPIRPSDTVDDLVHAVAFGSVGALRHQRYRYEQMWRDGRGMYSPLTHHGPVVNLAPVPPADLHPDIHARYRVVSTGPVADVNVNVYPTAPGRHRVELETNAATHTRPGTERLLTELLDSLTYLLNAPSHRRLTRRPVPCASPGSSSPSAVEPTTLSQLLVRNRDNDDVAVRDAAGVLTYRELVQKAASLGRHLGDLGVRPGDLVAVSMTRSRHSVLAFWASMWAGAGVVPIDPALPHRRQRIMLEDARPRVVVYYAVPPEHPASQQLLDMRALELTAEVGFPPAEKLSVDMPAYVLYTSGTTGRPKGVIVTHRGIADLLTTVDDSYELTASDVVGHMTSPGFDTSIVEMVAAAHRGASLAVVPSDIRSGRELAECLTASRATHLFITPSLLATLSPRALPWLSHIVVGGEHCPAPLINRWARHATTRCAYGPTETTCSVLLTERIEPERHRDHHIPLGTAMSGVTAWVLDQRLLPVPVGGEGEIYIAGPSLAMGYLHRPMQTATHFVADPFGPPGRRLYRTGDRVRLSDHGDLVFLGRADRQVQVHGVRVELGELDSALLSTGLVTAATTVAHVDDDHTRLHSYVVAEHGDVDVPALRTSLAALIASPLMPATITVVDALPMTIHNKLDHSRLPAPGNATTLPFVAPATSTESLVTEAFRRGLDTLDPISVTADFFDLGGDSLIATEIIAVLNARTGRQLHVRDVFEALTPRALAQRLDAPAPPSPKAEGQLDGRVAVSEAAPTRVRMAPAQRAFSLPDHGIANLIPFVLSVDAEIPTTVVRDRLRALIDRHDILRATFGNTEFTVEPINNPARWAVDEIPGGTDPRWASEYLHRPFDLATGYPLRIGVAHRRGHTDVAVAFHHVAVDGHSLRLIAESLITDASDAEASAPYVEYCREANNACESAREADLRFWHKEIDGLRVLDGHTDRPRRASWDPRAGRHRGSLPRAAWDQITAAARRHHTSPLTIVRTALALHLANVTGHRTIHIGAVLSGRDNARFERTVGMFVSTVPVACHIGASADETVRAIRTAENRAFAHAHLPFPELAAELGARDGNAHPLFQVMLTADDPVGTSVEAFADYVTVSALPVDHAKCDLHISVVAPHEQTDDGQVDVLYAAALFDHETIEKLTRSVIDIVSAL